eukprot:768627-Hanusia_phi.AAC.5
MEEKDDCGTALGGGGLEVQTRSWKVRERVEGIRKHGTRANRLRLVMGEVEGAESVAPLKAKSSMELPA